MSSNELRRISFTLVGLAAILYGLHYAIFRDMHHITVDGLETLAFLPLQVLFVTFLVDRLLSEREKQNRRHHMNMVIGTFFSSAGQPLLGLMHRFVTDCAQIAEHLAIGPDWTPDRMRDAIAYVESETLTIHAPVEALHDLRDVLREQRDFLLRLLENPTLLEHESFTDLLWATFHTAEELTARRSLDSLPPADLNHLCGDIERFYTLLIRQWLHYMIHLSETYPFLYSFAARTNPLRAGASAEVA